MAGKAKIFKPSYYKNVPADFIPKRREISAVTNAKEPTITTTEAHGYSVDQLVRLHISKDHGMRIEGKKAKILSVPTDTTFTVDFDTSSLFSFSAPSAPPAFTPAQCVPITGTKENIA